MRQSRRFGLPVAWTTVLLLMSATAWAHGGVYTGPGVPAYTGMGPVAPPPPPRGGATGVRPRATSAIDVRRWETWWAYNKEEYLVTRGVNPSGGDGNYARTRRPPGPDQIRDQIVPALRRALLNRDHELRNSAAIALGKVGDFRDLPALEKALLDRERSVVEAAILGIGLLRTSEGEKRLIHLVRDRSRSGRQRGLAVVALGLSGGAGARAFLTQGLGVPGKSPVGARSKAADLESLRAFAASLCSGSDLAVDADPNPVTGHLITAIRADAIRDRTFLPLALVGLAKTRDDAGARTALQLLAHRKTEVRASAAIAVGRTVGEPSQRMLRYVTRALASEGDPFPRRLLLIALGQMGGADARTIIARHLDDNDQQLRAFAILAMGVSGDRDWAPRFREAMVRTGDHSLKGAYAIALGLFRDRDSVKAILGEIDRHKNPEVREHLCLALALIGDADASPRIERLLVEANTPGLQAAAALTLGLLGRFEATAPMIELLRSSGTITVKGAAATGLGRMGDHRVLESLLKFVADPAEQDLARAFGCIALGILGEKSPGIPPFARATIDANYGLRIAVLDELRTLL